MGHMYGTKPSTLNPIPKWPLRPSKFIPQLNTFALSIYDSFRLDSRVHTISCCIVWMNERYVCIATTLLKTQKITQPDATVMFLFPMFIIGAIWRVSREDQ